MAKSQFATSPLKFKPTRNNMKTKKTKLIYDYLLKLILKNKYVPNYKLPSENALAEKFNSSRMCAQLAYEKLANENYVVKYKRKGCFINTQHILNTKNLNNPSEIKIALVFPSSHSKFLSFIYSTIYSFFKKHNIFPVLYLTENVDDENIILDMLAKKKFDGIAFYPFDSKHPNTILVELVKKDFPIVLIDRYYDNLDSYTVSSNHFASSCKIVEYLHGQNCKRICFISEPPIYTSVKHRYNGYRTALSHFPELLSKSKELFYNENQISDFKNTLSEMMYNKSFDSIITNSGTLANYVIISAKKHNLEIGKDFYLALYDEEVSFDNIIDFSYVKLIQDTTAIGNTAAEILFKLLSNETIQEKRHNIPTLLVEIEKDT